MKLHTSPLTTICYIYFACKAEGTSLKYEFISALRLLKDPEMKYSASNYIKKSAILFGRNHWLHRNLLSLQGDEGLIYRNPKNMAIKDDYRYVIL